MKLHIRETLKLEAISADTSLLEDCSIHHKAVGDVIEIREQKCTLNELVVNELFAEHFYPFDIEYAYIGGVGCDFAINIYPKGFLKR